MRQFKFVSNFSFTLFSKTHFESENVCGSPKWGYPMCYMSQRHAVAGEKRRGVWNYYLVLIFTLAHSGAWLTLHLFFKIKQRLRCVSCSINKQKQSLELLSSYFRCLAGSANKDCVSSIASTLWASKKKIENEIINLSVYKGNWIAFNQIELQMDVYWDWITITASEESGGFRNHNSGIIHQLSAVAVQMKSSTGNSKFFLQKNISIAWNYKQKFISAPAFNFESNGQIFYQKSSRNNLRKKGNRIV